MVCVPSLRTIEGLELSGFVLWSDLQNLDNFLRCPVTRQEHGGLGAVALALITGVPVCRSQVGHLLGQEEKVIHATNYTLNCSVC
jgi:hypothetical protein